MYICPFHDKILTAIFILFSTCLLTRVSYLQQSITFANQSPGQLDSTQFRVKGVKIVINLPYY